MDIRKARNLWNAKGILHTPCLALLCSLLLTAKTGVSQIDASKTSGCLMGGFIVQLKALETENPNHEYAWTLGDGRTANTYRAVGQYNAAGLYTVTLRITDKRTGIVRGNWSLPISVLENPSIDFTADRTDGCFPFKVNFTDESKASAGNSFIYRKWTFGNGSEAADVTNPSARYDFEADYTPTLRLVQSSCPADTFILQKSSFIKVKVGVTPLFVIEPPSACNFPVSVRMKNLSTVGPGQTLRFEWSFVGGTPGTSTDKDPTIQFASGGDFPVKMKAISDGGCEAEWSDRVKIPSATLTSTISTPSDDVCQGSLVPFVNSSTPVPDSSIWIFGNDPPVTGLSQFKRFNNLGTVNVTMVNRYGICEQRVTKVMTVKPSPGDQLRTPDSINCKTPHSQSFVYSGLPASQIRNIDWEFGDGNKASGPSPTVTHEYNTLGRFPVRMRVTDVFGCVTDKMFNERVILERPRVDSVKPRSLIDSGCAMLTFRPQVFASSRDGIKGITWDWGDGTPASAGYNPSHVYTTPRGAPYVVTATIETGNGCKFEEKGLVFIGVDPGPSQFTADRFNVCAGSDTVQFNDLSAGSGITGWKWEFGDGVVSYQKNPGHAYKDTGYMDVRLTVFNNGCPNRPEVKYDYIRVKGAISIFDASYECADRLRVTFKNRSKNADSYSWSFGDGSPITNLKDPVHTYPSFDTFKAKLTVTGDGCKMESTLDVIPVGEPPEYDIKAAFTSTFCSGNTLIFTAQPKDPKNISRYEWDFGNGTFTLGDITASNPYPDKGVYRTRLRLTDKNGCSAVQAKPPFAVGGPNAGFKSPIRQGCTGLEVDFTDTSIAELNSTIVERIWDFGDGTTTQLAGGVTKVKHKYNKVGSYHVKLTIVDDKGCRDVLELTNYVIISDPKIDFAADMTNSCPDKLIRFTNSTKMDGGRYSWEFGDGKTSQTPNPIHRYSDKGKYTVTLNVVDGNGCAAAFKRDQYINIDVPVSDYELSETFSDCPPLTPTFTFKGSYHEKVRWEFGDGGVSDLMDPKQVYLFPGTYSTRLIVTSPGGCQATSSKTIVIEGPVGSLSSDKLEGCDRATVNFRISNSKDVAEVIWDFDEGTLVNNNLTASYTYTRAGIYKPRVFLKNPKGCVVPYGMADSIRIIGVDPGFLSQDSVMCDKGQARFTDTTRSNGKLNSWLWDFGNGNTSTARNPTVVYSSPGAYKVKLRVTTEEGCVDEVERYASVRVVKSPEMAIDSDPSVCQDGRLLFSSRETTVPRDTSVLSYLWDFGNGQTSNLANPTAQTYTASGNYSVRLRTANSSGCVNTALRNIVVHPLPEVGGPDLETICLGQSVTLRPTGGVSYQWLAPSPNLSCTACPTPVANPSTDTRYTVRATNAFGCVNEDSIWVRVIQPSTVTAAKDDSLCLGESVQLIASGAEVYSWSPPTGLSNPNIPNPIASPTVSTRYVVTATDRKSCFTTQDIMEITVFPIPISNAGRDTVLFVGFGARLNATYSPDVNRYEWTPSTGLSCYDCPNPVASPKLTTNYTVRVFNSGGCTSSDAVTVFVVCKDANLYMPNTFSPNGDGMNDVYYPRGRGIQLVRSLRIFNRWGEQVYRRDNFNANEAAPGWDGRHKGRELAPDVFVWIVDVVCDNNTIITLKGDVALVR